jgi:acyl-coenzyme A synthetase/AMP-(fatty) acid ligase
VLVARQCGRLAHFKCPVGVLYVEALPRTASGKLQKATVRAQVGTTVTTPESAPARP